MNLTTALTAARSSLQATAAQIAITGKNISGASDPSYSRKLAPTSTTADGAARLISITRASDLALYTSMLGATSKAAGQQALSDGLQRLAAINGDPESGQSPAARLVALSATLQKYANQPDDMSLAQGVLTSAADLAGTLNSAAATIASVRQNADGEIADSVANINDLLAKFETLNTAIVQGTFSGADVTDTMDQRDAILAKLGEQIGVSTVTRANNDMVIYTDGGVTLFETKARNVTFQPTNGFPGGANGNAVYIDGVAVTGAGASMPLRGGRLMGLAQLRDDTAPTFEAQLDELARGLVEAFAETDQSAGGGPAAAGLFTYAGGPTVPASGTLVSGLAASIRINPAADPSQGGTLQRLRDGGINGAGYVYNATGASSFSTRLDSLVGALSADRSFDPASALTGTQSLTQFGAASTGWLDSLRQTTDTDLQFQTSLVTRASDALSNTTGVNLDDEYALQLQLEQSYAAASKLIGVVNELFTTLMQNV